MTPPTRIPSLTRVGGHRRPATVAGLALDRHGRLWLTAAGLEAHTYDGGENNSALSRAESTYRGVFTPFLTGIRKPLAITLGPDRSVLVADWSTGTIYRMEADSS